MNRQKSNRLIECIDICNLLTSAILIANIGKTPNVAQINSEPNNSQEKFSFLAPCFTFSFRVYGNNS